MTIIRRSRRDALTIIHGSRRDALTIIHGSRRDALTIIMEAEEWQMLFRLGTRSGNEVNPLSFLPVR